MEPIKINEVAQHLSTPGTVVGIKVTGNEPEAIECVVIEPVQRWGETLNILVGMHNNLFMMVNPDPRMVVFVRPVVTIPVEGNDVPVVPTAPAGEGVGFTEDDLDNIDFTNPDINVDLANGKGKEDSNNSKKGE